MAKGLKTGGGSRKGRPNKATAARESAIAASGLTPLEYMLGVMRDEQATRDVRLDAAAKAAPYVHPKLASIVHKGDAKQPVIVASMNAKTFEAIARKVASEV